MEVERQAAVALKWNTAAKVLSQTFSWAVTLIVARLVAPDDYGLMAISVAIVSVIAGMAEFGLGASLIQAQNLSRVELARVAGALGALNLVCGAALVIAAPWLATAFGEPRLELVIRVSALQFALYAVEVVPQSLIQRELNFKKSAGIDLAAAFTSSAATLLLAWTGAGVWALIIGNLAGSALRTLLLVVLGPFIAPSWRFTGIARHLRFGGLMTVTRFFWQLTYQADTLIGARYLTGNAVGLYSVSMQLAALPINKAMGIVNQVAFPAVARLQHELPRLRSRLLDGLRLLALVAIPVSWGISAVAPELVDVVLGSRWQGAIVPLQLISLIAPLRMLMGVLATAVAAIGRAELELRNTLVAAVLLPLGFFVGVQWNLVGLAASWVAVIPLILLLNFPRTSRAIGCTASEVATSLRGPVLAGVIMYAVIGGTRSVLPEIDELFALPLLIVVGAITYLGAVRLLDRAIWTDVQRLAAVLRS